MKECIISHGNCPDGCASVVLAKTIYEDIDYVMSDHKSIDDNVFRKACEIEENGILFLADISCSEKMLNKVIEELMIKEVDLCIYEHHESQKWLLDYSFPEGFNGEIIFTNDFCATKIFYRTWLEKEEKLLKYSDFIEIINDRDLWINKKEEGKTMALLHNILGDHKFIERFYRNSSVIFSEKEKILLDYQKNKDERKINKLLKRIKISKDKKGYKYGIIYGEGPASDLLNRAIEINDLEYAILVNLHGKTGSIRGRGHFDCSKFAQRFSGGGHKKASGFRIDFNYNLLEEKMDTKEVRKEK